MSRRRIVSIVGTRPNFMKSAPVVRALRDRLAEFDPILVHTGQHYDAAMSDSFLEELDIGTPDHFLGIGSGTHAVQTARVMERLEPLLIELEPDLVLVPGDVNSTLAAALVAAKLDIPIGHVEAGLRSFDHSMPEEVNRVLTDQLADLLFTHSPEARENLAREGRSDGDIYAVGNTMIDSLVAMRDRVDAANAPRSHGLSPGEYLLVTLHRPALVDGPLLSSVMCQLDSLADRLEVIFPVHPRTRARLGDTASQPRMRLLEPMGYVEFLGLMASAAAVLTDSGGIQEETTYLGVPCLTLRDTTERPVTCQQGTNVLLGLAPERIADIPEILSSWGRRSTQRPEGWDGRAAGRLVDVLAERDSYRAWAPPALPAPVLPFDSSTLRWRARLKGHSGRTGRLRRDARSDPGSTPRPLSTSAIGRPNPDTNRTARPRSSSSYLPYV